MKNDVFVGNLAFDTNEQHLLACFSDVGGVTSVKLMTDSEGKSRGFGFVEFSDPNNALSAIRNMNGFELNGRSMRVNFSNNSHLEGLAAKLGLDMSAAQGRGSGRGSRSGNHQPRGGEDESSVDRVAQAVQSLTRQEMHTILSQMKAMATKDADEARALLTSHPQLPEALLHIMSKCDMIKTPLPQLLSQAQNPVQSMAGQQYRPPQPPTFNAPPPGNYYGQPPPPTFANPPLQMNPMAPLSMPPRGHQQPPPVSDPRRDPRLQQQQQAPPPAVPGLNPALVQQVMGLTDAQIQQLPPDKQQSILALRNQIIAAQGTQ